MKSNTKKRLIAFMLCMVLVLSSAISAFADDLDTQTQDQTTTMSEPTTGTQEDAENKAQTEQPTAEIPAQNTEEAAPQTNDSQSEAVDQSTNSSEENNASDETVECEATQLKQEVDNGNHTKTTVVADIPAGAFHAHASEITMEVKRLSTEDVDDSVIVKLIKNALTTNTSLSNYVLYDVVFKVNSVETEPLKAIDVNFKGSGLKVKDTKKATAFYFAPAKSEDGIEEDLLVELPQREDKIKELLDAGTDKTMEQIEDEFDFSELSVKDEVADELKMEVRKNQVYGCYVVEDKKETKKSKNTTKSTTANISNDTTTLENETDEPPVVLSDNEITLAYEYGKLTASYTGSSTDYGYVWFRNINNNDFVAQSPTRYTSTTGTALGKDIKDDGTELYIALNGGALGYKSNGVTNTKVQYYVAVYNKTDIQSDGTPVDGATPIATSATFDVTSYYEVQNGSFETPKVYSNYNHWQYSNSAYASAEGVWQTTGVGTGNHTSHDIEIINTEDGGFKSPYSWYGSDKAADGNQFAELNCEAAGALYQDVLTTPGETLNYQLAHRARGSNANSTPETDTMYVVIMSTEMAITQGVTTQDKVQDIINNPGNYPGATVAQYSATDQAWSIHQGSYRVLASSQYSTRFFFVSGATASGSNTVGNFLDDIKFTRDVLTPVEGTANVTFTKTINGLETSSEADKIARGLTFKVGSKPLRYSDLTWSWANGVYTGSTTFTLSKSECGTLDVKEEGTLDTTGYTRSSALFVNNTIANNGTSGSATVKVNRTVVIEFKNNYTKNSNPGGNGGSGEEDKNVMTHEKYIKKNADGTYDITLNASGSIGSQTNKAKLDIVLVVDTSGSMDEKSSSTATKTKLKDTQDAINALVDEFSKNDKKVDAQYKLVTFSAKLYISF